MVEDKDFLKQCYESIIDEYLDYIRFKNREIKVFQEIKENFSNNEKIVKSCDGILSEIHFMINKIRERIKNARYEIEKIK